MTSDTGSTDETRTHAGVGTELTFYAESPSGQLSPDSGERTRKKNL